jgi:hypothetical protein
MAAQQKICPVFTLSAGKIIQGKQLSLSRCCHHHMIAAISAIEYTWMLADIQYQTGLLD